MICSKCNSKWESQSNTVKCPFCGADLPKSKEIESISDAIEKIVSDRGIDILHKPKLVYSLVTDYIAGYHKEKKLLSILAASDVFEKIFDLCSMSEEQEKSLQVRKIVSFLENDVFLSKDNAELILDIIFKGLNIQYTFIKEKIVQPPVEERQPQHSKKPISSSVKISNETPDELFKRGKKFYNGEGVPFDRAEALKWYRKAADQGHIPAKYNLGVCYENGRGVTPNLQEAIKYYEQAAEYGHKLAKEALERIKNRVTKTVKADTESINIHLKHSSSPFSPADGSTYVIKIGNQATVKLISGKADSFGKAEVPTGEYKISVSIYGYGDPNCLKAPTWTAKEQSIIVEKGRSYIIEITPSKFMGSPKIAVTTE